jgi:putative nucleotidyltransferase with HDIG domain
VARSDGKLSLSRSRPSGVQPDLRVGGWPLVAGAVAACFVLSALLTLELLPAPVGGLAAGMPQPGDIADHDEKAPFALNIVDPLATERLRREAGDAAPIVYDFDDKRAGALHDGIASAFATARLARGAPATPRGAQAPPADAATRTPSSAFRDALGADVEVPDASLAYLERTGFAPDDERLVQQLVEPVAARMVVDDAVDFDRQADARTVVVRDIGSGSERTLKPSPHVLTDDSARTLVERNAADLMATAAQRAALVPLARALIRPNLNFNLRATDERRKAAEASVKEATISLRKGEIIVRDGDPITERHVLILNGIRAQQSALSRLAVLLGVALLLFTAMRSIWRFGMSSLQRFPRRNRDAWFLLTVLVGTALGTSLALFLTDLAGESPRLQPFVDAWPGVLQFVIPVASATMLVRMVQSAETAALFAALVSLIAGLQVRADVGFTFYTLAGSLTAALGAARVMQRGTLMRAGLRVGLVNASVVVALLLLGNHFSLATAAIGVSMAIACGALCGIIVSGLAPVIESLFSYTTDVKLLELANREQSLLRELELRAPGTYHHSMMVGHLAEKAAEAIGANALLAKVAGYYHDIGKMRRPQFFVENVINQGENRHEKLSPSMSARIIQAHVKDGVEMAEEHHLALPILRGIMEHHGTSVIRFFYEKAKEVADPEKGDLVAEHDYRYPGPKPQTREAGILMLADSVEAASRTLADTAPARVQQLVQRIINNYFRDGQLDECNLTLRDLHAIARSFIDTLSAIRHERIDYPETTDALGRRAEEGVDEGVLERGDTRPPGRPESAREKREDDLKRLGLD